MTTITTPPEIQLTPGQVTEPAKRWRNRWRAILDAPRFCYNCGHKSWPKPGEVHDTHCGTWPSKDIAESKATEYLDYQKRMLGHNYDEHLGAFEVNE